MRMPMNLHEVPLVDGGADLFGYRIPLARDVLAAAAREGAGRAVVGFRPDALEVLPSGEEGLVVTTEVVEELGSGASLYASLPGNQDVTEIADVVARIDPRRVPEKGRRVTLRVRPDE